MSFVPTYDRVAGVYDVLAAPILRRSQREAVAAMDLRPGMRVLEAGAGTGLTLPHYPKDVRLTGVDLSEPMLRRARQRAARLGMPHAAFELMDVTALRFGDGAFERVFAPSLFSVVDDPGQALSELLRVVTDDGLVCVLAHFAGRTWGERLADALWDPFARAVFGYRMTTPRAAVEGHPGGRVVLERACLGFNFSTLYLLRKTALKAPV